MLYCIKIVYIGTCYSGFQSQADQNGIQDHLEKSFGIFFRNPVKIKGASRTDRGVHAFGQIATFQSDKPYDKKKWLLGLNSILPKDIQILDIEPIKDSFHPIRDAQGKAYCFRIWEGHCYHPFIAPYVWSVRPGLCRMTLREESRDLIGYHDFSSFCNKDSFVLTKDRTIFDIQIEEHGPLIQIWVLGDGFLKQMVRIMVGTLVSLAYGKIPKGEIPKILNQKNRAMAPPTAPAQGLSLVKIFYDEMPKDLTSIIMESYQGFCVK